MKYDDFNEQLKKECGVGSEKLDVVYNEGDSRCWTALISRNSDNILITFHVNREFLGDKNYDVLANRKTFFNVSSLDIWEIIASLVTPLMD